MESPGGPLDISSGRSWEQFCDRLKEAGRIILRPEAPQTSLDRAEGFRYLGRLARLGLELSFELSDPDFPCFVHAWNATTKAGSDNPDNHYLNATVRGDREYRLRGIRGTTRSVRFATLADRSASGDGLVTTGELRSKDMFFDPDGRFEVAVSREPHQGNWLPLARDSSLLIVRQSFADRATELPATMAIERIGGPATPRPLSLKVADWSLREAASFVSRIATRYADWAQWFQSRPNQLFHMEETPFVDEAGDPRTCYLHGYWAVPAEQALVLEIPMPGCENWNFQLSNYWMESLDYRYHKVCVNKHSARYNPDGSVTLVAAASNPGHGNFLDTAAHGCGMMILRWTGAKSQSLPLCRLESLAALRQSGRLSVGGSNS